MILNKEEKIIEKKIKDIRFILSDVDGVLTDGALYVGSDGTEYKKFDASDNEFFNFEIATSLTDVSALSSFPLHATAKNSVPMTIVNKFKCFFNNIFIIPSLIIY